MFLRFLQILARFWEAQGRQKIGKQLKKSRIIDFLTRSVLEEGSGTVLERFWEGFGWMDFGSVLE